MRRRERAAGLMFAATGMLTWGLVPVFAHRFASRMDPLLFGGLSTLIGGAPLLASLVLRGAHRDLYAPRFRPALGAVAFFGLCSTLLLFFGTTLTSGINTGLLLQLEPLYSVVVAATLLAEAIAASQILASLVMMVGAAAVVFRGAGGLNFGDILVAASPCFSQLSHVFAKRIIGQVEDANVIPAARLLYGGLGVTAIALAIHPESLAQLASPNNWLSIVEFGLVFRSLDLFLWYQAIKRISLSRASAVLPLSAGVSFLGSIFILGEPAQLRHIVGLALILCGLAWLSVVHLRESGDPSDVEIPIE